MTTAGGMDTTPWSALTAERIVEVKRCTKIPRNPQ